MKIVNSVQNTNYAGMQSKNIPAKEKKESGIVVYAKDNPLAVFMTIAGTVAAGAFAVRQKRLARMNEVIEDKLVNAFGKIPENTIAKEKVSKIKELAIRDENIDEIIKVVKMRLDFFAKNEEILKLRRELREQGIKEFDESEQYRELLASQKARVGDKKTVHRKYVEIALYRDVLNYAHFLDKIKRKAK